MGSKDDSLDDKVDRTNSKGHRPEDIPQESSKLESISNSVISKQPLHKEQTDELSATPGNNPGGFNKEDKKENGTERTHLPGENNVEQSKLSKTDSLLNVEKIKDSSVVEVVTAMSPNEFSEVHDNETEAVSGTDGEDETRTNHTTTSGATLDSMYERRKEELLERHKTLLERRHRAGHLNMQLQTTLSEHFRRKRVEGGDIAHSNIDSMTSSIIDTGIDYTSRYAKHMETLAQVRNQFVEQKERLEQEMNSLKNLSNHKISKAANKRAELVEFLLSQGKKAISSRTGRPLPMEHYKNLVDTWQKKATILATERLENLKLQRQVEKINAAFKAYDLSESLHLIDFEQMKIENQTYSEKIEERNEETGKLSRKITNTVQMITHANEKLQFCQAENSQLKDQLNLWAEKSSNDRDTLSKLKQSRDALRANHAALVRACGLLGRPEMLRGYEQSVNDVELKKYEIFNTKQLTHKLQAKTKVYENKISRWRQQLEGAHNNSIG